MENIIKRNDNMRYVNPSIDAISLMKISDLLITDYSSVGMEFLLLNKPLLFIDHLGKKYSDPNNIDIQIRTAGEIVDNVKKLDFYYHIVWKIHIKKQILENSLRESYFIIQMESLQYELQEQLNH